MKILNFKSVLFFLPLALFFFISPFDIDSVFHSGSESNTMIAPIKLPIEVLGPDGYTRSAIFSLKKPENAEYLYLKIHSPSYRDASTKKDRGAKASIRINDENWISLDNTNVEVFPHEKAYGGLNGSYHTVRMKLLVTFKKGENKIDFRFNGTDGITNGYRVLELNMMKGDSKLMNDSFFAYDDPNTWKAPLTSSTDIAKGKDLWFTKTLRESPVDTKELRAKCTSCHAKDGRDLKYFNYSNWSIIERSKYHGLTETEGKQIASYIRSLDVEVPKIARPWNPPYQPGPGLDSKPVNEWAAGAGLDYVLETDAEAFNYAFTGTSKQEIERTMNINGSFNVRENPISLQFPDWNAWLPVNHPIDLVGDAYKNVAYIKLDPKEETKYSYKDAYLKVRELVENNEITSIIENKKLYNYMNTFANHSSHLHDVSYFLNKPKIRQGVSANLIRPSFLKWSAVKQWEIMHTFDLEDKAPKIHPYAGEPRSWFTKQRNVFEIAPHRSASGTVNFPYQSVLVGKYFSTAWYQLQLTINSGNKRGHNLTPVDWNYQPAHISNLRSEGGPSHFMRYMLSDAKMLQQFNDGRSLGSSMTGFRQLHIGQYFRHYKSMSKNWSPAVRNNIIEAQLNSTMDVIENYSIAQWKTGKQDNFLLHSKDKNPEVFSHEKMSDRLGAFYYGSAWMTAIVEYRKQGISEPTLKRLTEWGEQIWTNANWDTTRIQTKVLPLLMEAEDFSRTKEQLDPQGNPWIISDKTQGFSGLGYVGTPNIEGASGKSFADGAALYYDFKVKKTDDYYVWVRRFARGGTSDSAFFGMDGQELQSIDHQGDYNKWQWVRIAKVNLEEGIHTLQISRREDGYLIDQILISTKSNLNTNNQEITLEGEDFVDKVSNDDTEEKGWFISTYVKGFEGEGYVATKEENRSAGNPDDNAAIRYNFNIFKKDTYTLWVRQYALNGNQNSARFYLDDVAFDRMDMGSTYNKWTWVAIGKRTLSEGMHWLQVHRREDGYRIDKFLLTASDINPNNTSGQPKNNVEDNLKTISIYPNPVTSGSFFISLPDGENSLSSIEMYDMTGKIIRSVQQPTNNQLTWDIHPLAKGTYFLKLNYQNKQRIEKVIVQ